MKLNTTNLQRWIAVVLVSLAAGPASPGEITLADVQNRPKTRVTKAQREAAAKHRAELRAKLPRRGVPPKGKLVVGPSSAPSSVSAKSFLTAPGGVSAKAWPDVSPMAVPGGVPDYFGSPNWAFSPPLRKFVTHLPGLGPSGANELGQYLSVANPDTLTYPGSDYYEIELREFEELMHPDLPNPTRLRGYVQRNLGTDANGQNTLVPDPPHYLGATIVAQKDRPVRIKFINRLPTGDGGNLYIPVDTTVMGAGEGPKTAAGADCNPETQDCAMYTQNRATLHLHGGRTPWISDGTPHQWITPAGEATPYPKGVSVVNVPDMPEPEDGSQTFFYTNQQSARLMFYHDHSYGITRLNVYVGEAAGYIITDTVEQDLVARGVIPPDSIPLIVQDKSFVDADTVRLTDPTWNWGTGARDPVTGHVTPRTGDLWYPHVYSPAQNPYDLGGANTFGRWHYGPWFWPPTTNIKHLPIPNPYYDPVNAPWQPPEMPATPNPSIPGESFMDTAMVNGTPFPVLEVKPKAYRFRILNAANDRFFNLQLYVADPSVVTTDGRTNTEVKMVPAVATPGFPDYWPIDNREGGVPDPTTRGPDWLQFANEGGFLPMPTRVVSQPIAFNANPTTFNFGNVSDHSLLVAPAERADVVVDFSAYRGKTLILYNDAPAAFPASEPRVDYYTGAPDQTDTGGHPGPQPGFGPNTRTVMQIRVADEAPATAYDFAALQAAFRPTATAPGVFDRGQDPIIVGQAAYDEAYGTSFPKTWPMWGYSRIQDSELSFHTLDPETAASSIVNVLPMKHKAIHDEMGAAFDMEYGRMSGKLGLELPRTTANAQNFVLQNFVDPTTEIVSPGETQIWKITHNGVDTHPIHFHLFDVQLLNRVGWDGAIRLPDPNELGWKDTVRISPLEDTIVALRPVTPQQPFGLPDSWRVLSPSMPLGSTEGFMNLDANGQPLLFPTQNNVQNFGWEYVWHCHILSHEEDDMMRPVSMYVPSLIPASPVLTAGAAAGGGVELTWTDGTPASSPATRGNPANEIGFVIQRATGETGVLEPLANARANQTRHVDATAAAGTVYRYRVIAHNVAGEAHSNIVSLNAPAAAAAEIGVDPAGLVFADQRVGTTSAAQQVTVSNAAGAGPLTVGPIAVVGLDAAEFASSTACGVVAAGGSCNIDVRFSPKAAGARSATLEISSNDPVVNPVQVSLAGTGLGAIASLTPATLDFGAQRVRTTSAAQLVTLANTGNAPLEITEIWLAGSNFGEFAQTNTCGVLPINLAPGASCTATVTFSPAGRGARSASLSVAHGAAMDAAVVMLAGTGAGPQLGIAPGALSFGDQYFGSTSAARPITLTNSGDQALQIASIAVTGANPTAFVLTSACGASLAVGATCTADVAFSPGTVGAKAASLNVTSDDPMTPVISRPLSGVGVTALGVAPASLTFPAQMRGVASAPQSITFSNRSANPLTISAVSLTGVNPGDYALSSTCGASLDAGASCTASVTFTPTTGGTRTANVAIASSDTVNPTLLVPVTGSGIAAATGVTLTPSVPSPLTTGAAVIFTATGTGPTTIPASAYQYRFWFNDGSGVVMTQDWSATTTWTMPGARMGGNYTVSVDVRTSTALGGPDSSTNLAYAVTNPRATGATVMSSQAAPVLAGTPVTFTAAGQGSFAYEYQFWLSDSVSWTMVRDYGPDTTWVLPATTPAGSHTVQVWVRANRTTSVRESYGNAVYQVVSSMPATSLALTASPPGPSSYGTPVTFTAAASGGLGAYQYRFLFYNGSTWTTVQDYGASASWTMPATTNPALCQVVAQVRTGTTASYDRQTSMSYRVGNPPATGVTLTSSVPSPQASGTSVAFTASGQGSTGYQYRFWLLDSSGWKLVQDFNPNATWTMYPSPVGSYTVAVQVRTNAIATYDSQATMTYQIGNPKATGLTLNASVTSPQPVGSSVTFTAAGQGSTGYQYAFWIMDSSGWRIVQDWSTTPTWTMPATTAAGLYAINAQVRTNATATTADTQANLTFRIGNPPATGVTLDVTPASPQNAGSAVQFTAAGQGSTGYQYQFWMNNGSYWSIVQPYSGAATWTVPTTLPPGIYSVYVTVRTNGTASGDANSRMITYVLN